MAFKYNMLICPFKLRGRKIRNLSHIMKYNMLDSLPIIYRNTTIGHVDSKNVRVGSDGFYGDLYVNDIYQNVNFEFSDLNWCGISCDVNECIIDIISLVKVREANSRFGRFFDTVMSAI